MTPTSIFLQKYVRFLPINDAVCVNDLRQKAVEKMHKNLITVNIDKLLLHLCIIVV